MLRPSTRPPPAARFICPGCGLDFPRRGAAHPHGLPPHRCLPCAFLATVEHTGTREALRRVFARAQSQRCLGGHDDPPLA